MSDVTEEVELTVDELARSVGMTVRNVRAHQSRGLLPPPTIRGRTGYYGPEHRRRLEMIKELQAAGLKLQAIERVLETAPEASEEALDFARAVAIPFADEEPQVVSVRALTRRWGDELTPEVGDRIRRLGLGRPLGEDRWEVRSPRLAQASEELASLGLPLSTALDVVEDLLDQGRSVADTYVELFLEHVWRPFKEAGEPEERWQDVRDALDRLRPLAGSSLLAAFQLAMTDAVEEALERELSNLARKGGGSA